MWKHYKNILKIICFHFITYVICFHFLAYIITITVYGTILMAMCMVLTVKWIKKTRRTRVETFKMGEFTPPSDSSSVELFNVTSLKRD